MSDIFKTDKIEVRSVVSIETLDARLQLGSAMPEIAIIGRSNVGKSTLLNKITYRKNLAFSSKTPGKTQMINFFNFNNRFVIADLPGYGYANVSKEKLKVWSSLITHYILKSLTLQRVFLLIDSRRGLMEKDISALQWLESYRISTTIVLTKADYIPIKDRNTILSNILGATKHFNILDGQIIYTSSKEKLGDSILRKKILLSVCLHKD